jgi:hypothetical protein
MLLSSKVQEQRVRHETSHLQNIPNCKQVRHKTFHTKQSKDYKIREFRVNLQNGLFYIRIVESFVKEGFRTGH